MADTGVTLPSGSGGVTIDTELLATRGFQVQRVKIALGAIDTDGGDLAAGQATTANSLSVTGPSDQVSAKGVQPSAAIYEGVQQPKDAGRTYLALTAARVTGVASETLLSCTQNKGGTTSSVTSYTVSTGKTLRVQSISATIRGSSTAAAVNGVVNLRAAASGIATTSPLVMTLDIPAVTDTAAAGNGTAVSVPIPDGLEFASTTQIALTQNCSTTSSTVSVTLIGFEY